MLTVRAIPAFFLFILLLCTAFSCAAASPPLILHANTESSPLAGHIDILEDKTGSLTISQVSSPETGKLFSPDNRAIPNFGVTAIVYWVRFTIKNEAAAEKRWLLELDFPLMDYLDLYVPSDSGFDRMQAGDMRRMSIRKFRHRNSVFPIFIDGPDTTFYLRIDAGGGRAILPLTVWSPEAFSRMENRRGLIDGCYFGAMMVMIVYNFFVFLSLRDRNYIYYILDIFFFTLYMFCIKGFLLEFLSGEMPLVTNYAAVLAAPVILTGLVFCRNFLSTGHNVPFIDRIIKIWMLVGVLSIPAIFVVSPEVWKSAVSIIAACASVTAMVAGIVCLQRGYHPARYYVGARIFRVLGVFSVVLGMHNILPANLLTNSGLQMGSILEVVFLSFALTDRINIMRREKEEAQADTIRSSHLAALGELAAGVAHEINTPVNTIINSADLILENENRKDTEHDVDVIKKQGRRIATIVNSLLFFSRRPANEKVPFAVAELLQGTLDLIGTRLRKENVTLAIRIPPGLKDVLVHPQQIEQVFLNILTNAMQALDERHGVARDSKTLEVVASDFVANDRPYVRITFLDNGIGIPVSLIDTVKEAFVTTKKSGTGLGLSISQQIIVDHGGAISIESKEKEYTKVSIHLPAAVNA
jgi:two-component system, sensor histidine kinase LadS